jgi:hypothetical protein
LLFDMIPPRPERPILFCCDGSDQSVLGFK